MKRFAGLLLGLWLAMGWATPGAAEVRVMSQAHATIIVGGETLHHGVTLPFQWDSVNPGRRGEAVFDFQFELPQVPDEVWGIFLPRVGNAYEIWLNGVLLQHQGVLVGDRPDVPVYNGSDYARVPRYITVDSGHFQKTNQIRVHIRADVGRRGGLAPPVVGPQDEVYPLYVEAYRWRATGSVAVVAFCLVVGLTALALWSTHAGLGKNGRVGRDPLYLFAAVAQLFWAVYVGDVLVESPPLPWPWWGMVQSLSLGIWGSSMVLACMELADWRAHQWANVLRHWMLLLLILCPGFAWLALGNGKPVALTLWYVAFGLTMLAFTTSFLWGAVRHARAEQRMVAIAAIINVLVAVRDIYVFRIDPSYPASTWLRYSSVLFGLAMGYVVLMRFRATSLQLHDLLGTLASRVSEKEQALKESYDRLEALARQQERTAERSRILRNMHDGVGAHISSAMRQLQGAVAAESRPNHHEVLLTLRDAMDQLKLSIDAIHLVPGDVTAMLANLRYRLGGRFQAMGIELQWDVGLLPPCPALDASAMSELQFMLFEALSNVMQHADSKVLRIEAHVLDAQSIAVRVVDFGRGFDVHAPGKRGLASLRDRARVIGAKLQISSQPGKTVVEIKLAA